MSYQNHTESERVVKSFAARVMRRLEKIPQKVMSRDDVMQELWVAWCRARDAYDPKAGIPWEAYLRRGMRDHINSEIRRLVEKCEEQTFAFSLDEPAPGGDTEEVKLGDIVPCPNELAATVVEQNSNYERAMTRLSDRAHTFVQILRDQPEELLNGVLAAQDKAEFAKKLGSPYLAPRRLTSAMVFDVMGATRTERTKILMEVEGIGEVMSQ